MHPAAYQFVAPRLAALAPASVLEIGSLDVNSSVQRLLLRALLPGATWVGIDSAAGPGSMLSLRRQTTARAAALPVSCLPKRWNTRRARLMSSNAQPATLRRGRAAAHGSRARTHAARLRWWRG